ncbi:cytochrome c biogenesis protein CcsA [Methylophilaceae bacterium]|nr:cytochrome c biogenesis protein CcsA [Methylophilaceae bacterium]MDA9635604.1 cytochrome c biogenesis protein CcsA [Nitrosomonadales bacterium]
MNETLYLVTLILYLIPCLSSLSNIKIIKNYSFLVAVGLISHALLIYNHIINKGVDLSFANSTLLLSWIIVLIYLLLNSKSKYRGLEIFTLIPALIIVLVFPLIQTDHQSIQHYSLPASIHIIIAMLGYGLLTFGSIFSLFLLLFEKSLHAKTKSSSMISSSEPLLDVESKLFQIYWVGFIFLTFTLFSSLFFSNYLFGQSLDWNHKTIFTILAWLSYSLVLFGRVQFGWRGKKSIIISLLAFVFLILAYLGTKFVVEIVLV